MAQDSLLAAFIQMKGLPTGGSRVAASSRAFLSLCVVLFPLQAFLLPRRYEEGGIPFGSLCLLGRLAGVWLCLLQKLLLGAELITPSQNPQCAQRSEQLGTPDVEDS